MIRTKLLCLLKAGAVVALVSSTALSAQSQEEVSPPQATEAPASPAQEPAPATAEPDQVPDVPPIPDPPRFLKRMGGSVGDVNGDIFWWGQGLNLTGEVLNNAVLTGASSTIAGTVRADAVSFSSTTTVTGEIFHNLYAFTGTLIIAEDAVIHGHVICFCGSLTLDGTVRGQVTGSTGITSIGGNVGSLELEVGHLAVTPTAVIHGDLEYESNDEAEIDPQASIGGEVRWNREERSTSEEDSDSTEDSGISLWDVATNLWWYLANFAVGVAFLLFGGQITRAPARLLRNQTAVGLGFGFVVAVVFPVACLVACLLLVTLPLGIIGLGTYALGLFLARLVASLFLGDWLLRRIGQETPSEYLSLGAGLLIFLVVTEIPYIGFLIWLTALFFGTGGMFLAVRGQRPAGLVGRT